MAKNEPQPRRLAPGTPVFLWPTPDKADELFYVDEHGDLPSKKSSQWTYGEAYKDALTYPDHKLILVSPQDENGWSRWYYAKDRTNEDAYNWEFAQADLGGQKFDAVRRTYLVLRSAWLEATPAAGATMPDVPAGRFSGTYVMSFREEQRTGDELFDALYVIERRTYVKKVATTIIGVDQISGLPLPRVETLYYGTEKVTGTGPPTITAAALFADTDNVYWGLQDTGIKYTGRQLSANWFAIVAENVVPTLPATQITGTSSTGIPLRSYHTEKPYYWPAILRTDGVNNNFDEDNDIVFTWITYKRRYGSEYDRVVPRIYFANPSYRGPTKMLIGEWWVKTPLVKAANPETDGGLPEAEVMIPREVEYIGAQFNERLEPTLHATQVIKDNVGDANDPNFKVSSYGVTLPATAPFTNWPASLRAEVGQDPYQGGYVVMVATAYRPDHYVAPSV